ncbi:MAG: hypothetical protein NVSMB10_12560 [Steroidobacteraceae bacterium]
MVLAQRLVEMMSEEPAIGDITVVRKESTASAELNGRRFDIVILDLCLEQGTGFGVLRGISTMHQKPRIVVVLTNHVLPEYQAAALSLGATHFLDKAHDFVLIPAIVRAMLNVESASIPARRAALA